MCDLASASRRRLLWRQLHVGAAPAYEEIHHVHHCVFLGLAAGLAQLLSGALEQRKNCFARLAIRKKLAGQAPKVMDGLARPQAVFDALVNNLLNSLRLALINSSAIDAVFGPGPADIPSASWTNLLSRSHDRGWLDRDGNANRARAARP